jgi:hypothetical protein
MRSVVLRFLPFVAVFNGLLGVGEAKQVAIQWKDGSAPAEILACRGAIVANDSREEAQRVFSNLTDELVAAAIKARIAKIGEPFVLRASPGQVTETYPISFDFCMPIDAKPVNADAGIFYGRSDARAVQIGFCASSSSSDCIESLNEKIEALSRAATTPSHPAKPAETGINSAAIRSAAWQKSDPPKSAEEMEEVLYKLWPPAQAPFAQPDPQSQVKGEDQRPPLRELGAVSGSSPPGSPPASIDAPASRPVIGIIFSIPKG